MAKQVDTCVTDNMETSIVEPQRQLTKLMNKNDNFSTSDVEALSQDSKRQRTKLLTEMDCIKHKVKLTMFCDGHQILVCPKCVASEHSKCLKVVTVEDFVSEMKLDEELYSCGHQFDEYLQCLEEIAQENSRQSTDLQNRKQDIVNQVKVHRREINEQLDKMENEFLNTLSETYTEEKTRIEIHNEEVKSLRETVLNSKEIIDSVISNGGDFQLLSTVLTAKSNTVAYKQKVIKISEKSENVDINFEVDRKLKEFSMLEQFATAKVVRMTRGVPKSISSIRQMYDRKAKEIRQFHVRLPSDNIDCVITSGIYMTDGRLVICDFQNRCIKIFRDTGVFLSKLLLPSEPFGICKVDDFRLAVTQPNNREITIVSYTEDQINVIDTISLEKVCYGIEKFNGHLAVLLPMEKPIPCLSIFDLNGTVIKTVKKDGMGKALFQNRPFHLAANLRSNEIIVTQKTTTAKQKHGLILKTDMSVKTTIQHKDIRWSRGVAVDFEENIYICGQTSANVIQFTPDGNRSRVLLSAARDGIQHPTAIAFNSDNFFLTDLGDENKNILKIFEMI